MMDKRLNGADLYVMRQRWKNPTTEKDVTLDSRPEDEVRSLCSNFSGMAGGDYPLLKPLSLHNELKCKVPTPSRIDHERVNCEIPCSAISSRPCYRCISYMQWADIRRVFWTNSDGKWEGGKVRDLVDALDLDYASVSVSGDSGANLGHKA